MGFDNRHLTLEIEEEPRGAGERVRLPALWAKSNVVRRRLRTFSARSFARNFLGSPFPRRVVRLSDFYAGVVHGRRQLCAVLNGDDAVQGGTTCAGARHNCADVVLPRAVNIQGQPFVVVRVHKARTHKRSKQVCGIA